MKKHSCAFKTEHKYAGAHDANKMLYENTYKSQVKSIEIPTEFIQIENQNTKSGETKCKRNKALISQLQKAEEHITSWENSVASKKKKH